MINTMQINKKKAILELNQIKNNYLCKNTNKLFIKLKVSKVSADYASKQAQSYVLTKKILTLFYSFELEQNLEKLLQVIISYRSRDRAMKSITFIFKTIN